MRKLTKLMPVLLLFLFVLFCTQECRATDTISISEPIQDPEEIVSSGQTFKLGFFSPENGTGDRYVGIIMNIPSRVVVWVANRDRPLEDSEGVVTVSEDGNLVVMNGQKKILWSSNVSNSVGNSSARILDTGNMVLRDNSNERVIWESFQIPTDSFVKTMRLGGNRSDNIQLTSWKTPSDPSIGNFSFGLDPLRMPEFFIWNQSEPYWRSGPWNGNVFIGVPGMSSAYQNRFELIDEQTGSVYFTHAFFNDSLLLYYVLSSSGVLSEKASYYATGISKVIWSSLQSECDVYGKCGPFGMCNPQSRPICTCLKGFEPRDKEEWDTGNWTGGCSRKALLQCERYNTSNQKGKPDGFLKFETIKVPDFADLIEFLRATTEEECGNQCLKNCSCIAFSYNIGIGCMHWSGNLIDIQQFSFDGADLYLRLSYSEIDQAKSKGNKKAAAAITASVGSILIALSAYLLWKCLTKRRGKGSKMETALDNIDQSKLEELPLYSYEALANATDNFDTKNKLGQGKAAKWPGNCGEKAFKHF